MSTYCQLSSLSLYKTKLTRSRDFEWHGRDVVIGSTYNTIDIKLMWKLTILYHITCEQKKSRRSDSVPELSSTIRTAETTPESVPSVTGLISSCPTLVNTRKGVHKVLFANTTSYKACLFHVHNNKQKSINHLYTFGQAVLGSLHTIRLESGNKMDTVNIIAQVVLFHFCWRDWRRFSSCCWILHD